MHPASGDNGEAKNAKNAHQSVLSRRVADIKSHFVALEVIINEAGDYEANRQSLEFTVSMWLDADGLRSLAFLRFCRSSQK